MIQTSHSSDCRTEKRRVRRVLKQWLKALIRKHGRVCKGDHASSSIHDLRVACRRAEAALRVCRDVDERSSRWLRRRIASWRRACDAARDDDVMTEWMARCDTSNGGSVACALGRGRDRAIETIARRLERSSPRGSFQRRAERMLNALRALERKSTAARWITPRLFAALGRVVARWAISPGEPIGLHKLRIEVKRLRYAFEFAARAFDDTAFEEPIAFLKTLQERTGALHDHFVRERHLSCLERRESKGKGGKRPIRKLLDRTRKAATVAEREFWNWWETISFDRFLASATNGIFGLIRSERLCDGS